MSTNRKDEIIHELTHDDTGNLTVGTTVIVREDQIRIGPASYNPMLILEAAFAYMEYSREHDWSLYDDKGLKIARDDMFLSGMRKAGL